MAGVQSSKELVVRSGGTIDEQAVVLSEMGGNDPQFLHAALCQLGLPRNPTASRTFERTSGRASLSLQAGRTFDGIKWNEQPLPSGTRPRLVLINLCSEAVRTKSSNVDIGGSVREFLRRLNIDAGGESMAQFRRQMLALSACHMTLAMATANGTTQIDAKPIDAFRAWHTNEDGQQTLWPGYIRLTDKFFDSLMEHAVPLQPEAIGELQNSAFALDVYSWLAHRLCRVNERNGVTLSWGALRGQFGQEYADPKNFKRKFLSALQKATSVYKDARIESVTGGLKLLPSAPPVRRKMIVVTAIADVEYEAAKERRGRSSTQSRKRTARVTSAAKSTGEAVSHDLEGWAEAEQRFVPSKQAVDEGLGLAPGWSRDLLVRKFVKWASELTGPLRLPVDRAFICWVPSFTKGKSP